MSANGEPEGSHSPSMRPSTSTQKLKRIQSPQEYESGDEEHARPVMRSSTSTPGRRSHTNPRTRTLSSRMLSLLEPQRTVGRAPGTWASLKGIILSSWLNLLLVFIPVSWALNFAKPDEHTLVFVFSFLAIIPLAKLLAFATDDLSIRVGQTLAGLLNATLGNAVELIVAIIALIKCELRIVQSSLIGSILSNLLLVLGMCFFAGGMKYSEQGFGLSATQLNSSLLTISVIAVLLPAAFHVNVSPDTDVDEQQDILKMSHGVAVVLLFIYASYLFFQLYSHTNLYDDNGADVIKSISYSKGARKPDAESSAIRRSVRTVLGRRLPDFADGENSAIDISSHAQDADEGAVPLEEDEDEEVPNLSLSAAIILLTVVTVDTACQLVAVTAEWLVGSIDGLTQGGVISKEFVGIILLPIVGNAAEHATAVTVSVKDKLTLSLGVAVGSSIQIALFVIPFIVVLAWILGKPLTLLFDPYESVCMFLAVLTVNYVVQDGKSNWLEGMLLMCLYVILGVTFWFYPGSDHNPQCH